MAGLSRTKAASGGLSAHVGGYASFGNSNNSYLTHTSGTDAAGGNTYITPEGHHYLRVGKLTTDFTTYPDTSIRHNYAKSEHGAAGLGTYSSSAAGLSCIVKTGSDYYRISVYNYSGAGTQYGNNLDLAWTNLGTGSHGSISVSDSQNWAGVQTGSICRAICSNADGTVLYLLNYASNQATSNRWGITSIHLGFSSGALVAGGSATRIAAHQQGSSLNTFLYSLVAADQSQYYMSMAWYGNYLYIISAYATSQGAGFNFADGVAGTFSDTSSPSGISYRLRIAKCNASGSSAPSYNSNFSRTSPYSVRSVSIDHANAVIYFAAMNYISSIPFNASDWSATDTKQAIGHNFVVTNSSPYDTVFHKKVGNIEHFNLLQNNYSQYYGISSLLAIGELSNLVRMGTNEQTYMRIK